MALSLKEVMEYYNDTRPFPEKERDPDKRIWKCSVCGENVEKTRRSFQLTPRCKTCSSVLRKESHPCKTDWPFLNDLTEEYREKVKAGLITQRDEADFYCELHGIYRRTLVAHSQSNGCPRCADFNRSKGVDQVAALKARINTNIERYGTPWYAQTQECKDRLLNTFAEKYGVRYAFELGDFKGKDSGPNSNFKFLLEEQDIEFTQEFPLGGLFYDFKVGDTLIEINPTATHNTVYGICNGKPKEESYHLNKSNIARANGFKCMHIFDWIDPSKIALMLKPKTKIYARDCKVKIIESKTAESFLDAFHSQGNVRGQLLTIGLIYNDDLVAVMSFGIPRYNHKCDYELIRLCFHPDYTITGGSNKLFKFFTSEFEVDSIVSYCDLALFGGEVYEKLGFEKVRTSPPTAHWVNRKNQHFSDNSLRQVGFDNLVGKKLGLAPFGPGTSNKDLMLEHKFVTVYDCGQQTWIWTREK